MSKSLTPKVILKVDPNDKTIGNIYQHFSNTILCMADCSRNVIRIMEEFSLFMTHRLIKNLTVPYTYLELKGSLNSEKKADHPHRTTIQQ